MWVILQAWLQFIFEILMSKCESVDLRMSGWLTQRLD